MIRNGKAAGFIAACALTASLVPGTPAIADEIRDAQWHLPYLKVDQAHRVTKGAGVTVALVDSGVFPHRDLTGNLQKGAGPGGSGSGQTDKDGHGTRMAGIIVGHGHGTGDGILGIAPAAKLVPIDDGSATDIGRGVPEGITRAVRSGADVINLSVVVPDSRFIRSAVQAAVAADVVVVAGAGNTSTNLKLGYPAALPGVMAVGATDRQGRHAAISVTGPEMAICAPGTEIATTSRTGGYGRSTGTSDSTAIVSGAAALVRARFPKLSAPEVVHRLTATADDIGPPGKDEECGYGVLNIVRALTADVPPLPVSATSSASASSAVAKPAEPAAQLGEPASAEAVPAPKSSGSGVLLFGGIGAVVVAAGAVVALVLVRRRRTGV